MENLELTDTVKILQTQRAEIQKQLTNLDKAIAVLQELTEPNRIHSPNGKQTHPNPIPSLNGKRRTFSVAARRKMAAAQKARWAKLKAAQKTRG